MTGLRDLSYRTLIIYSIPSILGTIMETLSGMVDTAFVGRIDTRWLAALGISTIILNSFTWMFNFLVHSSTQSIGDALKKGQRLLLARVKISLLVGLLVGLLAAFFLFVSRHLLYSLAGAGADIIPLVDKYFIVRSYGHAAVILFLTILSVLRGMGFIQSSFWFVSFVSIFNIALNWYFLFYLKMGIEGAAWGTVIAYLFGLVFASLYLLSKANFLRGGLPHRDFSGEWFVFGQKSLNLFIRSFFLTSCFFIATRIAASLGVKILAAHHVMIQLWLFASFFTDGIAITGNVLGAQFFSQRKIKRLRFISQRLIHIGGMIGIGFTLIYAFGGRSIIGIFTKDSAVVETVLIYWPLIWASQIICSIAYVYDGLCFGLGEFSYLRKVIGQAAVFIFLPFSLLVFFYPNLWGVWIGLVGLNIFRWFKLNQLIKRVLVS